MRIEVRGITKSFGDHPVLRDVSVDLRGGELVALLGPSGCGKTTLLRIIAGLEWAEEGSVLFDGEDVSARSVRDRRLGFVFQHYALFRHMTVFENVAFGLRVRPRGTRPSNGEIAERVHRLLGLVRLEAQAQHLPSEISGGQRQRVALARALAVEPKVLLLDEPFGSLDAQVRRELRGWLRRLHEELHLTSLFVTHDQEEALELADRVVIMKDGGVIQTGTPEEVYRKPADPFVYHFLGSVNLLHGRIDCGQVFLGEHCVRDGAVPVTPDGPAAVYVRPHELEIAAFPDGSEGREFCFPARVRHVHAAGPSVRIEVEGPGGDPVTIEMPHGRLPRPVAKGDEVWVRVRGDGLLVVPAEGA